MSKIILVRGGADGCGYMKKAVSKENEAPCIPKLETYLDEYSAAA